MRKSLLCLVGVVTLSLLWLALLWPTRAVAEGGSHAAHGGDPMTNCYGAAHCDRWVFTFTHALETPVTLTVQYQTDEGWSHAGRMLVAETSEPLTVVSAPWEVPPPLEETMVRFVAMYNGAPHYKMAMKPECSPPTAVQVAQLEAARNSVGSTLLVVSGAALALGAAGLTWRRRRPIA